MLRLMCWLKAWHSQKVGQTRAGTMSVRTEMNGKALNGILAIDKVECASFMGLMQTETG